VLIDQCHRNVAIKVILKGIAGGPSAIQHLQTEAKLIACLEHPHIVPVYDFDGTHQPPYFVVRYLDGGTLKDVMVQGLLPHNEWTDPDLVAHPQFV